MTDLENQIRLRMEQQAQEAQFKEMMKFFAANFMALNSKLDHLLSGHEKFYIHLTNSAWNEAKKDPLETLSHNHAKDIIGIALKTFNADRNKN
jgi:hypothetical protein